MTATTDACRRHLLEWRERTYGVRPDGTQRRVFEGLSQNLRNAIEQLSTGLYEKEIHFVLELIQNAEDNEYDSRRPELRFVLSDDDPTGTAGAEGCLCVYNNETGFEATHVESICQIGASTKMKASGYVGEKGIGFKSVFLVTSAPHIFSNSYQFRFLEEDPNLVLSYVVPYWVEQVPHAVEREGLTTAIVLPLKPGKREEVARELETIAPETILFLQKLEGLEVRLEASNHARTLSRNQARFPVVALEVAENAGEHESRSYWVQHADLAVPEGLAEEKRRGVKERRVTVAFPLDDERCHGRVYAYLPTEVESGLPFLVNADFLLTTNRESIQTARKWNQWLRDELADPVVKGLRTMREREEYRKSWYRFVPVGRNLGGLKGFFEPLCTSVCEALTEEPCILTASGAWVRPAEARRVPNVLRALLSADPLPTFLTEVYLVDSEVQRYSQQLRALDVHQLTPAELIECLADRDWLAKRPPDWFVELYKYIHENRKGLVRKLPSLPIVLASTGEVSSPNECAVWVAESDRSVRAVQEALEGTELPPVVLLHPKVASGCRKDPTMFEWIRKAKKLDLEDFSLSRYVESMLVPWAEREAESLDAKAVMDATSLVARFWSELNEAAIVSLKSLPVVLDDGQVIGRDQLDGKTLVTPAGMDSRNGWHLFLRQGSDRAHLAVLAADYRRIAVPDGLQRLQFLEALGATRDPPVRSCEFSYRFDYSEWREWPYLQERFEEFGDDYTEWPVLRTSLPPSFLYTRSGRQDKRRRGAFIRWLEKCVAENGARIADAHWSWFYYTTRYKFVQSAFYLCLTQTPWLRTTKGWKRPGQCFRRSEQLQALFGSRLAYLKDDLSEALCEFLGVKSEATTGTVIAYLGDLADSDVRVEPSLVAALYEYLERYGKNYAKTFAEHPLIWAPGSGRTWWRSTEVVWEDASVVLGALYGYLEPVYGARDLRDFFLGKLDVSLSVRAQELVRAWAELPSRVDLQPNEVERALAIILAQVGRELHGEVTLPDWWSDQQAGLRVWTQGKRFVEPENVFVADDLRLQNLFRRELHFVWLPEGLAHSDLEPLYESLEVRRLSAVVQVEVAHRDGLEVRTSAEILTDGSKRLLCYLIWNASTEHYHKAAEDGILKRFLAAREATLPELVVRYIGPDGSLGEHSQGTDSYWDEEAGLLMLAAAADREEQLDSAAETIARVIWGRDFKGQADSVRAVLGVQGEDRYRKLRDRKGWHMPREEMARVNAWIADTGAAELTDEPGPAPEPISKPESGSAPRPGTETPSAPGPRPGPGPRPVRGPRRTPGPRPTPAPSPDPGRRLDPGQRPDSTPGHGHGRGRSRSRRVTEQLNRRIQSRIVTYVAGNTQDSRRRADPDGPSDRDRAIGDRAEAVVEELEQREGRTVRRMPPGNPGYDLESFDAETGELRYIEVKGIDGAWGARGIGLSSAQFEFGRRNGADFWLYVVEGVWDPDPPIHRFRDPASKITEYRFDDQWTELAEGAVAEASATRPDEPDVEDLQNYTENEVCGELIARCLQAGLTVPDVGYEVVDERGAVLGDVELAWESHAVAVTLPSTAPAVVDALTGAGWSVLELEDAESLWAKLEQVLRLPA